MIPDFFSDDYHNKLAAVITRVDGMNLPNMLAGRVCKSFIKQVFSADLVPRSKSLVVNVRRCMQEAVSEVCDCVCKEYPTLLKVLKIILLDGFMYEMEVKTEEVVTKVCQAEYNWSFTQDPAFMNSLQGVHQAVVQTSVIRAEQRLLEEFPKASLIRSNPQGSEARILSTHSR